MKLLKATYRNFKGIKSLTVETGGGNVDIFGDNAAGKTTLFDGILWLLFDKDSQNKKDFDIKTLTPDGQVIHGLEHEVEAEFKLNGRRITFKKTLTEDWTKKRGSTTKEFTGHTTAYFVDGVPLKKTEYAAKIAAICDEDTFKLLTSPVYFNTQLHWQKRREILLEVCGDVSDADVIASDKALKDLPGILGDRSLDDHRKVIASRRKALNEELEKIPVRIDEAERGLPDVTGLDVFGLGEKKNGLSLKLQGKREEVDRIKNGGEVAERTKALREWEGALLDIKNKHRAAVDEKVRGKQIELADLKIKVDNYHRTLKNAERERADTLTLISDTEKEAAELRAQWHEVNGNEFTFEQDENCPTCGQALPEEKLEEAREKAVAAFNRQKAGLLEEISAKGRKCKASIVILKAEGEGLTKIIQDAQANLDLLINGDTKKLQAEIDNITASATDPTDSPEHKAAAKKKAALESEIEALQMGTRELLTMAEQDADAIKEQIQAVDDNLQKLRMREQGQARIKDLAAQEKKLAAEFEKLEQELYLTELFIKAKVALLEDKINSKFKHARFKLFKENINGGVEPCCETLYRGVPYSSGLNNAARINVGLDIISTLAEHHGFVPFIFIDNAEAVTEIAETTGQQIRLVVSKGDKQLRVETEGQKTLFGEVV